MSPQRLKRVRPPARTMGRVKRFTIVAAILGAPAVVILGMWLTGGPPDQAVGGVQMNLAPVLLVPLALLLAVVYVVASSPRR